jgi:hypothetical protein
VSRRNGAAPSDPLEGLDDAIQTLEGTDWEDEQEITTETQITVEEGGTLIVDQTGRHKPVKASDPPPSNQPVKVAAPVVAVIKAVNNVYALGALGLLVTALYIWLTKR